MSLSLKKIEEEALRLPDEERALLAEHLITTLDTGEDLNAEKAWIAEAEKRYETYKEGKLKSKPAEEVFEEAFKKLK